MAILVHSNDMLKQKVELLVQRLAESRRREQDLTDKLHELVHSMDTQEQIKDTPEQKVQQMDKAGWSQRVSALLLFQRFFTVHCQFAIVSKKLLIDIFRPVIPYVT